MMITIRITGNYCIMCIKVRLPVVVNELIGKKDTEIGVNIHSSFPKYDELAQQMESEVWIQIYTACENPLNN